MGIELKIKHGKNEINLTDFTIENFVRKVGNLEGRNRFLEISVNSLEIFGNYSVYDESGENLEVIKLANWAKNTAHEDSAYRRVELILKDNNDVIYDSLIFKKAFIVNYYKGFDSERGTMDYHALIREFNG